MATENWKFSIFLLVAAIRCVADAKEINETERRIVFDSGKDLSGKILTGSSRPSANTPQYPQSPPANQYPQSPPANQYPQSPPANTNQYPQGIQYPPENQYYQSNQYPQTNQYPQSPPDLSGQGSGPEPMQQYPNNGNNKGIPDIYLQLVGAIEKLVGRMDKLDHRLKTVESIVYFLTNKDKPVALDRGNCPENFAKIDSIKGKCFHISSFSKNPQVYDWKSAAEECRKMGGRLTEIISYDDFVRISQYILKHANTRNTISTDFWTGGINPGLIWIWSESGQQVDMDRRFWNENDNSSNAPGCLKLSYSVRLNTMFFKASPCSHPHNYLCEVMDNTVARALATFERDLTFNDSSSYLQNATMGEL